VPMNAWGSGGVLVAREPSIGFLDVPAIASAYTGRLAPLTAFERRVLALFAAGFSRSEIAAAVKLSPKTVSNTLTAAKEKVGARSLVEAAVLVAIDALLFGSNT
jgi:DNA-binding CsgD family transcriptional regulator